MIKLGKIYFNPKTGEFWESNVHSRTPPDGFEYTSFKKDYRYGKSYYIAESYLCPKCNEYHFYINTWGFFPLYERKRIEFTKKFGCEEADKLVSFAHIIGGKKIHFEYAIKLKEMGLLDKWYKTIISLKPKIRTKIIKCLLAGEDEKNVELLVIAENLKS